MKTPDWRQVDEIFQAAVELDTDGRTAFLDRACAGDPLLRSQVESLLTADSLSWDLIDAPALESAAILLEDDGERLAPGEEVGHYEILKLIGKGGMGEVYLARDRILNRNVALKLLPFYYTQNDDRLRRFQREAQAASAQNHPNIITIYELGSVNDRQFIATEFIEGDTLRQHIIGRGPLPPAEALDIALQTTAALAAAHKAGIVHRDIKPENIMLRPDGYVKVLDFGLAKLAERPDPLAPPVSGSVGPDISSGILMGTIRYMSPEQASGSAVDARTDIFSLGVVFYEMIAGRPPFRDDDAGRLVSSILNDDPPMLAEQSPLVPPDLAPVIEKTLRKDPADRYQDADSLLTDLRKIKRVLDGETKLAAGAAADPIQRSLIQRIGKGGLAMTLVLLLSSIGLMSYSTYRYLRPAAGVSAEETKPTRLGTWTPKAPISTPRYQVEPAVLNGRLYVVGGWNTCTAFADLASLDPKSDEGWATHAKMKTARGGHGVGVVNGVLYAVGGSVDCGVYTSSVEAYDPVNDTWSSRAPLPTERTAHAVAAAYGKLYAFGGLTARGTDTSTTTEYDPVADRWTDRTPMPTSRSGAAAAVLDNIIYVIGGSFADRPLATVEAYDPRLDSWTTRTPMRTPRTLHAASAMDGLIYVFGGKASDEVEVYDPATDMWTPAGKMPTLRSDFHAEALAGSIYFAGGSDGVGYTSSVMAFTPSLDPDLGLDNCPTLVTSIKAPMPTGRVATAAGAIDGIIYVAGGYVEGSGYISDVEAYDTSADKWAVVSPMPTARDVLGTSTAVVDGKLYVIGGNARGYCTNANEAYDPTTDSWTSRAPMPTPRCHVSVVANNGRIYAFGGTNTNGSVRYSVLEIYDPAADLWTTGSPMPTGRHYIGAVAMDGIIYAIGGWNPELNPRGALDVVEAYDPTRDAWTTLPPLPTPRHSLVVGALHGLLVAVGGENANASVSTVDVYDPKADSWSTLARPSVMRRQHSGVTVNNTLYIFGGGIAPYVSKPLKTTEAFTLSPCDGGQ